MIYALIFVSCSLTGGDCHKTLVEDGLQGGLASCMIRAVQVLPQWQDANPIRRFKKARCVDHKRVDFELGRNQA